MGVEPAWLSAKGAGVIATKCQQALGSSLAGPIAFTFPPHLR
jgi:hypothetical protein